ncbi:peptide/nickel transport system ATP-binding protein [Natronobacillus azotifigens]|uniref:Dipeptide/oligopeptide/nickel ABC transporter ATP-binding protein n=1 Tax=Natronobacillus azotifigens TaxID=472978 RepID=A0A9J6RCZ1_9BACI|nr:dipeptide/oligopeptide/nickel ABC transporter ATP-binding protein [Natronobacillus azotifigens]MCZ0703081.1 dipeptide/oligopeptide/nickel ABC transporter ATP-binding protein [Natronobacillus azotifigens]
MKTLTIEKLTKSYAKETVALDEFSLGIDQGGCIGIVGESGSGKSTLARILLGLESFDQGQILFKGLQIPPKKKKDYRDYRRDVQMVFQDATSALNPKLPIWKIILEPLDNFKEVKPSFIKEDGLSRKAVASHLLEMVGLEREFVDRYPYQLSGGQKQRVSIARAISLEPSLLICDEPTASLDVTVQFQILELLKKLQEETNMTILFISHDIRAVTFLCEKIVVLKQGIIVDHFHMKDLYKKNRHLYTKQLIKVASLS